MLRTGRAVDHAGQDVNDDHWQHDRIDDGDDGADLCSSSRLL